MVGSGIPFTHFCSLVFYSIYDVIDMMWLAMYRPRFVMFYPVLWTAIRNKRINNIKLFTPVTTFYSTNRSFLTMSLSSLPAVPALTSRKQRTKSCNCKNKVTLVNPLLCIAVVRTHMSIGLTAQVVQIQHRAVLKSSLSIKLQSTM